MFECSGDVDPMMTPDAPGGGDSGDEGCVVEGCLDTTLLPQLNLPVNLPAIMHQPVARFTVKDPNLLAPPEYMTPREYITDLCPVAKMPR